jgi:hypothetical protein
MHSSGAVRQTPRHGSNKAPAAANAHSRGVEHYAEETRPMMPHLPPDEAVVAALVLVGIGFGVIWLIEYWR